MSYRKISTIIINLALIASLILTIIFFRYYLIYNFIAQPTHQNLAKLTNSYQSKIYQKNLSVAEKFNSTSYDILVRNEEFINFAASTLSFFKNNNNLITIKNNFGQIIITNIQNSENQKPNEKIQRLLIATDNYFISHFMSLGSQLSLNLQNPYDMANGYNQIWFDVLYNLDDGIPSQISDGYIVVYENISNFWLKLNYLTLIYILIIFTIVSFFAVRNYFKIRHAHKMMSELRLINHNSEIAKIKAETENSSKTEFLANVSHELRTPLNAIIGFSEIILTQTFGKIDNSKYNDYINDINNSGKHLLSLINDILDFSKASVDKLKVENIEIDVNKLLLASMRFVKPRAVETNISMITEIPNEHFIINADPKRLKQAILNLLSNAVKFTPEGGMVKLIVSIDLEQNQLYIKIVDNGIGMAQKDLPKALSSFGQIDNKLSRKYEGTGLGLPLTKKLIELMNGDLDIKSEIGQGTTVTITFAYNGAINI